VTPSPENPPQAGEEPPSETPPAVKTMADRPHHISISLSVIAFVFSAASIYISWQAYQLSEATSRAVVQPTLVTITAPWKWNQAPDAMQQPIKFEMTVINSGKLVATSFMIVLTPDLCRMVPQIDSGFGDYPQGTCYAKVGTPIKEDDLGPGFPRTYKFDFDISLPNEPRIDLGFLDAVNTIRVQPNLYYADANGQHYEQPCFQAYAAADGTFPAGPIYPCNQFARVPTPKP
jgi:hypothetical protein